MENKNDLPKVTWKPRVGNVEIFMRRSRILESESTRVHLLWKQQHKDDPKCNFYIMILPFFHTDKMFSCLYWSSSYLWQAGGRLCKFPAQQPKLSLSPNLSCVRSHVSVCSWARPWCSQVYLLPASLCALKHMALIYDPRAKEQGISSWPQFYWLSQASFVVIPIC